MLTFSTEQLQAACAEMYPQLSPEEQREAAYYLQRYLELVARIAARQAELTARD